MLTSFLIIPLNLLPVIPVAAVVSAVCSLAPRVSESESDSPVQSSDESGRREREKHHLLFFLNKLYEELIGYKHIVRIASSKSEPNKKREGKLASSVLWTNFQCWCTLGRIITPFPCEAKSFTVRKSTDRLPRCCL